MPGWRTVVAVLQGFGTIVKETIPTAGSQGFSFRRALNDGNLGGPRFSTAVLHRPKPVAREMPGFIGFFVRRD
jgi:hypothetical protein